LASAREPLHAARQTIFAGLDHALGEFALLSDLSVKREKDSRIRPDRQIDRRQLLEVARPARMEISAA